MSEGMMTSSGRASSLQVSNCRRQNFRIIMEAAEAAVAVIANQAPELPRLVVVVDVQSTLTAARRTTANVALAVMAPDVRLDDVRVLPGADSPAAQGIPAAPTAILQNNLVLFRITEKPLAFVCVIAGLALILGLGEAIGWPREPANSARTFCDRWSRCPVAGIRLDALRVTCLAPSLIMLAAQASGDRIPAALAVISYAPHCSKIADGPSQPA
jgi:hypothetical protein